MPQYKIYNGVAPTTAQFTGVTTGTSIKTMLQLKGVTAVQMKVKSWGVSMDGSAAAAGIQWELLETGTVFGTMTQYASDGTSFVGWDGSGLATVGTTYLDRTTTTSSGYTCSSEGSIIASRMFDCQLVQPTGQYAWEFSLGNEPIVSAVSALRIRCKAASAVNAICWVIVEV